MRSTTCAAARIESEVSVGSSREPSGCARANSLSLESERLPVAVDLNGQALTKACDDDSSGNSGSTQQPLDHARDAVLVVRHEGSRSRRSPRRPAPPGRR